MRIPAGPRHALLALLAALACSVPGFAQGPVLDQSRKIFKFTNDVEAALVNVFQHLSDTRWKDAMAELDGVLKRNPNFKLGHLIRGDLLMARAGKPTAFAQLGSTSSASAVSVAPLAEEAKARITRYLSAPEPDHVPVEVLALAPWHSHVLLVDIERSRLFVLSNESGTPKIVADFYVSIGKNGPDKQREGDQKTPLGVYFVTESKNGLPDLYGPEAFPISYPNEWDVREGKNGFGIWLHGTPSDTYSRPPRATDGCVVLTNDDLKALRKYVKVGYTPVVITRSSTWRPQQEWQSERDSLSAAVEAWRADWESMDVERYLSHYSERFTSESRNYASWAQYKRNVAESKSFVKVHVNQMSAFAFSSRDNLAVVSFEQTYRSNNVNNRMWKRQYWARENGRWKILYEGGA